MGMRSKDAAVAGARISQRSPTRKTKSGGSAERETTKASTAMIDKSVLPNLATAPQNIASALPINDKFWLENLDKLNQRFNAWVAK